MSSSISAPFSCAKVVFYVVKNRHIKAVKNGTCSIIDKLGSEVSIQEVCAHHVSSSDLVADLSFTTQLIKIMVTWNRRVPPFEDVATVLDSNLLFKESFVTLIHLRNVKSSDRVSVKNWGKSFARYYNWHLHFFDCLVCRNDMALQWILNDALPLNTFFTVRLIHYSCDCIVMVIVIIFVEFIAKFYCFFTNVTCYLHASLLKMLSVVQLSILIS